MNTKKILLVFMGIIITSVGVLLLKHANLVTGGTAGLSLSLSYLLNLPFALTFFLLNIPFYVFSIMRMGWSFTLSTAISVTTLSVVTSLDFWLPTFSVPLLFGAIAGGLVIGLGLSIIFMNGSSLGGANILALYLQKRFEIDPGKTNFAFDFTVVLTGFLTVGVAQGFASILSIAITSRVISYFKNEIAKRNESPQTQQTSSKRTRHVPVTD